MKLDRAANYFAKTSLSGWDGTQWVDNIAKITLLPSDRFISVHEFDTKSQYALTPVDSTGLDEYAVVKITATDQVFMVGLQIQDVHEDAYSKFYLFKTASKQGEIYQFTKTYAASGMAKGATRELVKTVYTDLEHVTSVNSKTAMENRFAEATLYFPRDTVLTSDLEIKIDNAFWDVRDVRENSGLVTCRALRKHST